MKKSTFILAFLLLISCNFQAMDNNAVSLRAVYLVHGQGELSSEDLQTHPEIVVVQTFDEFKKYTKRKIALWVDKSATPFNSDQEKWINEAPQTYYAIGLVGTSDTLHSFRDLLRLCCFMGPADYPGEDAPGFSVIQWKESNEPDARDVIFFQGYNQKPTVQAILEITNALLEGRWKAMPTETPIRIDTATPLPPTAVTSPDLLSAAQVVVTAIETNQPEMLRSLIGEEGVAPGGFAQGVNPKGYNNADEIVAAFSEALDQSIPVCEGFIPNAGALPDKATLVYRGLKFDWSRFELSGNSSGGMTLTLFRLPEGWQLIYITPFDFEWGLSILSPLEDCPSLRK